MVIAKTAHYQLYCDSVLHRPDSWRFVLIEPASEYRLEVSDWEPEMGYERRSLLAVLRGLEAIDRRAEVTLYTGSRYVQQGLRHGLPQWREAGWKWERFDRMVPIKHIDLWRRIDHVLQFHVLRGVEWDQLAKGQVDSFKSRSLLRIHRITRPEQITRSLQSPNTWRVDSPSGHIAGPRGFQSGQFAGYTSCGVA